jgi:type III pantothenate kinase
MKADVVADVGNSRIKWGRCRQNRVVETASLPPDDPQAWLDQTETWSLAANASWALAGVHPERCARLADWLGRRGHPIQILDSWEKLPLQVRLQHPEHVGLDRLLNAVAASLRIPPGIAAVLIDAGSAITVDWLDETAAFAGGAIFPGLRLMAQALHDYTALLPLVELQYPAPPLPGTSTIGAIEAGVFWAAAGGIQALVTLLIARATGAAKVFMTGGDGPLLVRGLSQDVELWPTMTLEGIRIAAETTP